MDSPKNPSYKNSAELKMRVGKWLMNKFHATGFSRKEAAQRAGITEGYLGTILAGRTIVPGPNIVRDMAHGWGFPMLEFYVDASKLFSDLDVQDYIEHRNLVPRELQPELQAHMGRLRTLPRNERITMLDAFGTMLSIGENQAKS